MSLEERMTRLECENRWLKRAMVFAAVLFGAAVFMAAGRPQDRTVEVKVLRAQTIQLVDGNGNDVGLLGISDDSGAPMLLLKHGRASLVAMVMQGTPIITMIDSEGQQRVGLFGSKEKTSLEFSGGQDKDNPATYIADGIIRLAEGKKYASLGLLKGAKQRSPALCMADANGEHVVQLDLESDRPDQGPWLSLLNSKGDHLSAAMLGCIDGSGKVVVGDTDGNKWGAIGTGPM